MMPKAYSEPHVSKEEAFLDMTAYLQAQVDEASQEAKRIENQALAEAMIPADRENGWALAAAWPIKGVFYNARDRVMRVCWKKGTYLHFDVPEELYEAWQRAENPMKFHYAYVRGQYGERRMLPEEAAPMLDPRAAERPWNKKQP